MKNILKYTFSALAVSFLALSCAKDGDMLIATLDQTESGANISTIDGDMVLSSASASSLALTLFWDELGHITLNNSSAQIPEGMEVNVVQFSADSEFSTCEEVAINSGSYSLQLTVSQLNAIMSRLDYEPYKPGDLYIRIRSSVGSNTDSVYGESISIKVTPYFVDWSFVRLIPKADPNTVTATIPSEKSDGEYAGFVNVPNSWLNFYFVEGDETAYGHKNDGTNEDLFVLAATTDRKTWACWFPEGQSDGDPAAYACYYVTMSRKNSDWTAMRIRSISAQAGGQTVSLSYASDRTAWTGVVTTTSDNVTVTFEETGTLYNKTTKQAKPVETSYALVPAADKTLSMGESGAASSLVIPAAGTYTINLYLADMEWELLEGEQGIATEWPSDEAYSVPSSDNVYIWGLDEDGGLDATDGSIAKSAKGIYNGFVYLTSTSVFKFGDSNDAATAKVYGAANVANDEANFRLYCGDDMKSISYTGSSACYNYLTVDFNERSWEYEAVSAVTMEISGGESLVLTYNPTDKLWTATSELASWGNGIRMSINNGSVILTDSDADGVLEAGETYYTPSTALEADHNYRFSLDLGTMKLEVEDITGEAAPTYPDYLYAVYAWSSSAWPEQQASKLTSTESGKYVGYMTVGSSDQYTNWLFRDVSADDFEGCGDGGAKIGDEKIYGNTSDGQLIEKSAYNTTDGVWTCWGEGAGLYLLNVDLTTSTYTRTKLWDSIGVNLNGNWKAGMSFDTTSLTWVASGLELTTADVITLTFGDNYVYGGADGKLVKDAAGMSVAADGTYTLTIDLKDYENLTYTLTQN